MFKLVFYIFRFKLETNYVYNLDLNIVCHTTHWFDPQSECKFLLLSTYLELL